MSKHRQLRTNRHKDGDETSLEVEGRTARHQTKVGALYNAANGCGILLVMIAEVDDAAERVVAVRVEQAYRLEPHQIPSMRPAFERLCAWVAEAAEKLEAGIAVSNEDTPELEQSPGERAAAASGMMVALIMRKLYPAKRKRSDFTKKQEEFAGEVEDGLRRIAVDAIEAGRDDDIDLLHAGLAKTIESAASKMRFTAEQRRTLAKVIEDSGEVVAAIKAGKNPLEEKPAARQQSKSVH